MKAASISEIKKELNELPNHLVIDLCLRMTKYKKENKELLNYLLFEAGNETQYVENVKAETDLQFEEINKSTIYFAKKGLRKILRMVNKHIKFSGNKKTEAELLIYYCSKLQNSGIRYKKYPVLLNIYERQIIKIKKAISTMHPDLQYDYEKEMEELEN